MFFVRRTKRRSRTQFFLLRLAIFFLIAISRLASAANFYAGTSPANVPWPGGIVPYEFTNTLTSAQTNTYLNALREWELAGNVKFVPHTTQTHWILFAYNTNGFDNVSATTNPQIVSVASLSRAQVCHEMGHSFGFQHENIRPDATNYINVLTNNITDELDNLHWFIPDNTTVTNGNYDYESVMHLGWDFESTNPGVLPTQQPKPPNFPRYQFRMGNFALSPGDRAALAFLYGQPAAPLTNIVTTTADFGPGSLRAAMYYVQDHPGAPVKFNIPTSDPGFSNGVLTIHLTGQLPTLASDNMIIDGSTQPGFSGKPLIVLDASQIIPETFTSDTLLIYSANNQIKNISLHGFNWNGITLEYADATNNTISGNWIGLDSTGTNATPNAFQGILIQNGASRNFIGGTNALARNVLSGNHQYGIYLTNTTGNTVLGNYIGTDFSGSNAIPNGFGGLVLDDNSCSNFVGGSNAFSRNVISGNTNFGILISGTGSFGNIVQGNFAGLNAAGNTALPNTFIGMYIWAGAQNNFVLNNVFSGNPSEGLRLQDAGTSGNVVQGNFFGTDASGSIAIPNNFAGVTIFNGATSNTIGGTSLAARNVSSGNYYGIVIGDPGTSENVVEGNLVGIGADDLSALRNGFAGIAVWDGATNNFIGGINSGAGNIIAFNYGPGVYVQDTNTVGDPIRGNSIFSNGDIGINLVAGNDVYPNVTLNDTGDADFGPNDLQNFPVITNAFGFGSSTIVLGKLNSLAGKTFSIDFYRNIAANPTGYGEGQFYLGTISVTTDGSGNANFTYTNSSGNYSGQYITATATSASGDTSEFGLTVLAGNVPAPSAQFGNNFSLNANGFNFSIALQTNFNYRIQTTTNLVNSASWIDLTNFLATNSLFNFTDHNATNKARFYRVVSP
jgi:parallel beta-helix repeat protein